MMKTMNGKIPAIDKIKLFPLKFKRNDKYEIQTIGLLGTIVLPVNKEQTLKQKYIVNMYRIEDNIQSISIYNSTEDLDREFLYSTWLMDGNTMFYDYYYAFDDEEDLNFIINLLQSKNIKIFDKREKQKRLVKN